MNHNRSRIQSFTTPLALVAALLASNAALGDVTQGGDVGIGGIGFNNSGWMTITGGCEYPPAWVSSLQIGGPSTAHGTLTIRGINSRYNTLKTSVGFSGGGTVLIEDGGRLPGTVWIGENPGSSGSVTIRGAGSTIGGGVLVGNYGTATLHVEEFAFIEAGLNIGRAPGSDGYVSVSGGTVLGGALVGGQVIGEYPEPTGYLEVINGGFLNGLGSGFSNTSFSVFDHAVIDGKGSRVHVYSMNIAARWRPRTSDIKVLNGGEVRATGFFALAASHPQASAELFIDGEGSVVVVEDGSGSMDANFDDGRATRLIVRNGGHFYCAPYMFLRGRSSLVGKNGTMGFGDNLSLNSPDVAVIYTPSDQSGVFINIEGDLEFRAPDIQLVIPHNSDLTLTPGDRFPVIAIGGTIVATGQDTLARFDNREEGDIVDTYNGIDLYITYQGGDGNDIELYTLEAEPCLADLTGDGELNFFDVSAFLSAFGNQDAAADFTGDGQFNFFDVSAFLTAFSAGCP